MFITLLHFIYVFLSSGMVLGGVITASDLNPLKRLTEDTQISPSRIN